MNALKTLAPTLIASALIVSSGLAMAATPAASAPTAAAKPLPSSPAKKALIAKLLALQKVGGENAAMALMVQQPVERLVAGARQAMQQVPEDKREATGKAIDADLKKFGEEVAPVVKAQADKVFPQVVGKALEDNFTEDELRQLLTWFESPVNKKFSEMNGKIGHDYQEKLMTDTAPLVEPKVIALRDTIAKELGLAPAPAAAASGSAPAKK